jgi:FAD/FMN-containing dehydrogenase
MERGDWDELAAAMTGELLRPGAPGYEAARAPAVARFAGTRPAAVARCAGPADVAAVLAFATGRGIALAVRSGGHCFAGSSTTEGLVLDLSLLRGVTLDGARATIGAGAPLGAVYEALAPHGRAIPAGCGPTVAAAGLTLGGGLGILGRTHGLTSDALRGADVVLADGRQVTCAAEGEHADLLWALRGAGGARFGVVTSLVLETVEAPPTTAFKLAFPGTRATALAGAWQAWSPDEPDAMAASLLVTAAGTRPARVELLGAMGGAEADTRARIEAFAAAAGAEPEEEAFVAGSLLDAKRFLSGLGDGGDTAHGYVRSEFFARPLPATAIDALLRGLLDARTAGVTRELDLSPWGGAYTRVPAAATAFPHRDARFLLKQSVAVAPDMPAAGLAAARAWLETSWQLTHPHGTGGVYANFPETGRDPWDRAYHGANRERLLAVKRRYDPAGVFGGVAPSV